MTLSKARAFPALIICAAAMLSGCGGSDSTSPASVDANAAIQSLSLGLQSFLIIGAPSTPEINGSFDGIAPLLDQVTVTVNGVSQGMFALGLKETFPIGTCEEDLFAVSFPPLPGVCTPPQLGLALILWQAHSATQPPDRMFIIIADEGTSDFDFASAPFDPSTAFALYVDGTHNVWSSLSGTLTSHVTGSSQTCDLPLPPYAKSGTCSIATFNEQGSIVFEPFTLDAPSTQRTSVAIPLISLHGFWLAISEIQPIPIQPIPLTANLLKPAPGIREGLLPRSLAQRLRAARPTPAR